MTGIVTAMKCEAQKLLEISKITEKQLVGSQLFYKGTINGNDVVICVCGVGKVFAAICTQTLITVFNCDYIVNLGVAGSLSDNVKINDVVFASDVVQYDMDTSALGDPVGMISGINMIKIPCSEKNISKLIKAADCAGVKSSVGTIATGDKFFNDEETRKFVAEEFGAYAGEMEGGAVGQVCRINEKPFNIVRIISDRAGKTSSEEYEMNVITASERLTDIMKNYFFD